MKSIHIIMLCSLLLIQGISQSMAAPMMSIKTMTASIEAMNDMPCHESAKSSSMAMDDCCDQDCQCHFLASAVMGHALHWAKPPVFAQPLFASAFHFPSQSKNLYRPPISA